jgi:hypothetical protein
VAKKKKAGPDPEDLLNWMVCGEAGSGKTTALAYYAQLGTVLHCDTEKSLKLRPLSKLGVEVGNIEIRTITKFNDLVNVYAEARDRLIDDPWSIRAVNIDTANEGYETFLEEVLGSKSERMNRAGMDFDSESGREEHRVVTGKFRRLARKFRDLPCHVGWATHLKRETDDDGAVAYRPDLTPKFGGALQGFMDVITTHRPFNGGFVAVCRPAGKYHAAKDRIGFLPPVLAHPTADRVVALLTDKLDLSKDKYHKDYLKAVKK